MLHDQMQALGFDIYQDEIFNATYACLQYLRSQPKVSCHFMVDDAVKAFSREIPVDNDAPDFVVVGDYGERFDFHALNPRLSVVNGSCRTYSVAKGPLLVFF